MSIIRTATSRSRSILSIFLMIVLVGLFARNNIPLALNPDVAVPIVVISIFQDGISPEDGDRLLLRPIEQELRNIEGLKETKGTARESIAYLLAEFESEVDINQAIIDVREAVDRAKSKLPQEAEEPNVKEVNADEFPAIVVTLRGDVPERTLFQNAQTLQRAFEDISSVLEANMVGHREEMVEIVIDPVKLEYYGITSKQLMNAVFTNNMLIAAGEFDNSYGRFSIKAPGLIESTADVYNIPVKSTSDGAITLADITKVRRTFKDPSRFTSVNGDNAIAIEVKKRNGASQIEVSQAVRNIVNEHATTIPKNIIIEYVLDQSQVTMDMVSEMQGNIVTAMVLVMIIVVAALGLRSGFLVGVGIPFSLLFSIIILFYQNFSFNGMVMFAMILALGMLIDGVIVITEYADRKMVEGLSATSAYQASVKRMFWPVVASTATTLAAFLPLMFWPGVAGDFMGYLPVTVFTVLAGSLLYTLLFAPVAGSLIGGGNKQTAISQYLRKLETDPPETLDGITGQYARMLAWLMRAPIIVAMISLFGVFMIFKFYGQYNSGIAFFTETEEKYGQVAVRAQGNLSVNEVRDIIQQVEQLVMSVPGVLSTYSSSGTDSTQSGGPRPPAKDQIGTLLVELDEPENLNKTTLAVFADINQYANVIPGVIVSANPFSNGPPIGKPIQIQLASHNKDKLKAATAKLSRYLAEHVAGLRDVTDTTPLPGIEWEMQVDRTLAAQMGTNIVEVGRALQLLTNGIKLGEYRPNDANREVDIRLRYPDSERGMTALDNLRINTESGPVPIANFVKRVSTHRIDKITRVNGIQVMNVRADVQPSVLADNKIREIKAWLATINIDPEVTIKFRGANEEQEKSKAFLSVAFSLALFLMFIMLVTQFNSFYQALLILSSVVMSIAGVLLGLLLTGGVFSTILTGAGIVALAGIVVNNNIVLIDTYNHLSRSATKLTPEQIAIRTCAQRLRPVFLTTSTTILGLMPMASAVSIDIINRNVVVNGLIVSGFQPLASAVVHGLLFATLLTLIITPVMLVLPSRIVRLLKYAVK